MVAFEKDVHMVSDREERIQADCTDAVLKKVDAKRPSASAYVNFVFPQGFFVPRR